MRQVRVDNCCARVRARARTAEQKNVQQIALNILHTAASLRSVQRIFVACEWSVRRNIHAALLEAAIVHVPAVSVNFCAYRHL